jgi:hypothetical protein
MLAIGWHQLLSAISWHRVLSAMLAIPWSKVLFSVVWILSHVLLAVLTVLLYQRRLYREFPVFFTYTLCENAGFVVLFALGHIPGTGTLYKSLWCSTQLLGIVLLFGVIDEVSKDLFRESPLLKASIRRSLQCVTVVLLGVGIWLAVIAPGNISDKYLAGTVVLDRGTAIVQSGLIVSLLLFACFMGLSWRRLAFGIALGAGILTSTHVAVFALHAEFPTLGWTEFLNWLTNGDYLACVLIWIAYVLAPEHKPVSPTIFPDDPDDTDKEVETWNRELQQLLRQ